MFVVVGLCVECAFTKHYDTVVFVLFVESVSAIALQTREPQNSSYRDFMLALSHSALAKKNPFSFSVMIDMDHELLHSLMACMSSCALRCTCDLLLVYGVM